MTRVETLPKSENPKVNPLDQLSPKKYREIQKALVKGLQEMAKDKTALEEGRQDHKNEVRKFWESPDLDIPIRGTNF